MRPSRIEPSPILPFARGGIIETRRLAEGSEGGPVSRCVHHIPESNLLDILKGLLNPRLKLTDNYIITTFVERATVMGSLITERETV